MQITLGGYIDKLNSQHKPQSLGISCIMITVALSLTNGCSGSFPHLSTFGLGS